MTSSPGPWARGGWLDLAYRLASKVLLFGCGGLALLAAVWIAFGVLVLSWLLWDARPRSQIEFDAEEWRTAGGAEDTRYRMRDDLLDDHDFRGRPAEDVTDLLGRGCRDCGTFGDNTLAYQLGPRPWSIFGFDTVWLVFELDSVATVTDHRFETVYD